MKTAQEKWKRIYRCVNGPMKYYTYSRMEMLDLRYTAALERALSAANRRAERAEAKLAVLIEFESGRMTDEYNEAEAALVEKEMTQQ